MSPDERSTDQKLDDLSLTLDRVLGIVQDHSVALVDLKSDVGALRVELQHVRVDVQQVRVDLSGLRQSMDRLNEHVMGHMNWHIGQQPGGPSSES